MLVLFFAQGAKAYFAWVVFSCPLRNSFLISRHHANIRRWCYGVAPWVDVSEIPRRLTEALVAELSVCVAFGWSLYKIYSVQKFHQSRHLAKTKLHPEYPHRKQTNPALKTVSYEEIFPGNFVVGGAKKFLGKKKRFLRGNFLPKFPRPEFPQEILARILLAEEILKPKISWRHEEILRGNFGIT